MVGEFPAHEQARRPGRTTRLIHTSFGGLAGIVLFVIMLITVVDVIGRYLLNAPLPGGFEITQLLMAALIYAGLPSVSRQESHVTIDILDGVTPSWLVRPRLVVVNTVCAIVLGTVSWQLWLYADKIKAYGDVTEYLLIPRAPIIYYMSVLSGIGAVVFVANVVRYLRGHRAPASGFV